MSHPQNLQHLYRYTERQAPQTGYPSGGAAQRMGEANHQQYAEEFRQLDKNNDGQLSYQELQNRGRLAARPQTHVPEDNAAQREQYRRDYEQLGRNQDGEVHVQRDPEPTEEQLLFQAADLNNDGYIDFGEYAAAKENGQLGGRSRRSPYPDPSRREFNRADTNNDNRIDFREFVHARRKGLLGGEGALPPKKVTTGLMLDGNVLSILGLLLAAIFLILIGMELGESSSNFSLCREYGYVAACGFCLHLLGMLVFSTGGEWCSIPVAERGSLYFAKLLVLSGIVGLATVTWGMSLGFTMNGGEKYLVETCAYVLGICCFVIAIGRVVYSRKNMCQHVIAWVASVIMFIIGILFVLFGHFYGEGTHEDSAYGALCVIIGSLFLVYMFIVIAELMTLQGFC